MGKQEKNTPCTFPRSVSKYFSTRHYTLVTRILPFKAEAQTALFKDPIRTAL